MNAIAERMARQRESLEAKERAIEAFNVQNFKRAEQHLSSAIELDPDYVQFSICTPYPKTALYDAMREQGITVRQTAVGDRYVLEDMNANGFSLGGEQSGHVIMSAHDSSDTADSKRESLKESAANLDALALGKPLHNVVRNGTARP